MDEQKNEMNSQAQEHATENKSKKKRNGLFTLFACIMTAIIVVLAMNIGQQLSKGVDKKSSESSNSNSNEVSNSNSNEEVSNSNSNEASNSNENSNTTSNNNSQTTTTNYTNTNVTGVYSFETKDTNYSISLLENGLFELVANPNGPACGGVYQGNYYIEGNTITLNSILKFSCDGNGIKEVTVSKGTISNNGITFNKDIIANNNATYKKSNAKVKSTNDLLESMFSAIAQGAEDNN